ncbi:MAG: DUF2066 domain-containing protein [Halioglobus sp.]
MRAEFLVALEKGLHSLRSLLGLFGFVFTLLFPPGTAAAIVPDLYSAQVQVNDRSAKALEEGAQAALAQVLVKVSGSSAVLDGPDIRNALKSARSRVQTYVYASSRPNSDLPQVRFEFDPNYVTDLVRQSGAPLWTANRPAVLAWVVLQEDNRQRFLNEDTDSALARDIKAEFSRRGLALQLPLHDLKDANALSAADAWSRVSAKLRGASKRYAVKDIAVARVKPVSGGEYSADWAYLFNQERITASSKIGDSALVMGRGANLVADSMASRYAVRPSSGEMQVVRMLVSGVFEYADYAGVVRWLRSLEPISYANLERMQGDRLTLVLGTRANPASLRSIIELNEKLVIEQSQDPYTALSYRWQN